MKHLNFRTIAIAAAAVALTASANALTLDWTKLQGTSTLAFSQDAITLFQSNNGLVKPLGNAATLPTAGAASAWTFSLPITSITITPALKIGAGQASGSALNIVRQIIDIETGTLTTSNIVIANFPLDYTNKKVLADTTPKAGATRPQFAVFDFNVATPLALKYQFPLSISGHEVLNKLKLTPAAVTLFASTLGLTGDSIINLVTNTDFGTLTQDVSLKARKPAVSKVPYVPAP